MWKHKLEAIRDGNKRVRCTICQQTWTDSPRVGCPGCPVYPFEELPAHYKTLTALWRERKYPPDPDRPDAAYRILKAPYYRYCYDERTALHQPLTEKQIAAKEKQRATMRAKYGCRLCDTYYRKEDQQWFQDGVCSRCQSAARSWNQLIEWARNQVDEEATILDITTAPPVRPIAFTGSAPDCYYDRATNTHLIEWHKASAFQLTGYQLISLLTGGLVRDVPRLTAQEDVFELRHYMSPLASILVPPPRTLVVSQVVAELAYRAAHTTGERNPNLEVLPMAYHYQARIERSWSRILEVDARGKDERGHLEHAASVCGLHLEEGESTGQLLRRFVLHLAEQEMIEIGESSKIRPS